MRLWEAIGMRDRGCKACEQCEHKPKTVNQYEKKVTPKDYEDPFPSGPSKLLLVVYAGYFLLWESDGLLPKVIYILLILYCMLNILVEQMTLGDYEENIATRLANLTIAVFIGHPFFWWSDVLLLKTVYVLWILCCILDILVEDLCPLLMKEDSKKHGAKKT